MKVIFRLAHSCLENRWNISIQRKAEGTFFLSFCLIEGTVIQYSIWCWVHTHTYTNKGYIVGDNKKQQGNLISFKLKKIGLSSQHNLYCKLCLFSAPGCVCVSDSDETGYSTVVPQFSIWGSFVCIIPFMTGGEGDATCTSDSNYLAAVKHLSLPLLFASTSFVCYLSFFFIAWLIFSPASHG